MALDYGSARTGVAVSDPTGTLARPLGVVERAGDREPASPSSRGSSRAEEAERVVVGLPLTLRGTRGEQAAETERFVEALRGAVDVPVELYDERFTTDLAQQTRRHRARGRARGRASPLDLSRVVRGALVGDSAPCWSRAGRRGLRRVGAALAHAGRPPPASCGSSASSSPKGSRARRWRRGSQAVAKIAEHESHAEGQALGERVRSRRPRSRARSRASARRSCRSRASSSRTRTTSTASRRSAQLVGDQLAEFTLDVGHAEPLVRAEQEPHAVRRAHDRVDGRGRGAGAERAAARRRRHLQPAARRTCRSASTRRSATGCTSRRRSR